MVIGAHANFSATGLNVSIGREHEREVWYITRANQRRLNQKLLIRADDIGILESKASLTQAAVGAAGWMDGERV